MLICGSEGFIGKNLVDYFSSKPEIEVIASYHKEKPTKKIGVTYVESDLTDRKQVEDLFADCSIVLQYAAVTSGAKDIVENPYIHISDNAIMNSLMLRTAVEKGVEHFIFPSCSIMYQNGLTPLKEDDVVEEKIEKKYLAAALTKIYLEKMCKFYSQVGKTKFSVLRQSNIYGPYDKYFSEKSHVFAATISKVLKNKKDLIVWGEGKERRDFLHVSDLINLLDLIIKNQDQKFCLVNAAYGSTLSVSELVHKIVDASKKDLNIEHDLSSPTIPISIELSNQRANDLFGWKPSIDIDRGIEKTLEWCKKNVEIRA